MSNITFGNDMNTIVSLLMSSLLNTTHAPKDFHSQAKAVEDIIGQDTSGLISSLTDFQVGCATVDVKVDTDNTNLNDILNEKWLINLNSEFRGQGVQTGLKGLMKEYYKERWQGASFPVLKITKWDEIDGINLPVSMIFVDGGSIYAQVDNTEDTQSLLGYKYFLGKGMKEEITSENCFMYKIGCRWFKKYPVPYLIRRGVYKHWKIIDSLKNKQMELLNQVIPYLLMITKGSEALEIQKDVTIGKTQLTEVKTKIQELIDRLNKNSKESPLRATNWDEVIKHVIPDLRTMFEPTLSASAEKGILAGLGFLDIAQPISSRRDSFLNPKAFIKEVNDGIEDFKLILKDILDLIKEKNQDTDVEHRKYNSLKWKMVSAPMVEFATDEFLKMIRNLRDKGIVSNETMDTIVGVDYELEKIRRERELENGDDLLLYPPIIQNQEEKGIDIREMEIPKGKEKRSKTPDDKIDPVEKQNYSQAKKMKITSAPYSTLADLPDYIKKLPVGKQKIWLRSFNYAWNRFKSLPKKSRESRCFKYANGVLKKIGKGMRLTKSILEKIFDEETNEIQ